MYQPGTSGFSERRWNDLRGKSFGSGGFDANPSFGYRPGRDSIKPKTKLSFELTEQTGIKQDLQQTEYKMAS